MEIRNQNGSTRRERWEATARSHWISAFRSQLATCNLQPATFGFTLIELLIVLAIIGLLTTIALPHLKGLTRSNIMASANEQLLADLASARQRAINGRSVVSVVFMPAVLADQSIYNFLTPTQQNQILPQQFRAASLGCACRLVAQPVALRLLPLSEMGGDVMDVARHSTGG